MIVHPARFPAALALGAIGTALLIGIPTDVIPTDLFSRMTPVRSYDGPVLVAVSGGVAASRGLRTQKRPTRGAPFVWSMTTR